MTRNLLRASSPASPLIPDTTDRAALANHFAEVRAASLAAASPLSVEDQCVQSMADASPTKWHLAHTTWFFEAVVLLPHTSCEPFNASYLHLFNSYYESLGSRHPRAGRWFSPVAGKCPRTGLRQETPACQPRGGRCSGLPESSRWILEPQ